MIARELLAHDFQRLYGLPFTIFRYSPIYGPHMWPGLALNAFINAAKEGGPIIIFGDGYQTRSFLHVDDLVDAFVRSLNDNAQNEVYNLEGPQNITVNELAEKVSCAFGGIEIVHYTDDNRRGELRPTNDRIVSQEKVKHSLGWIPRISIDEGIQKLLTTNSRGSK
ncbi:NAD-dependent epimerase/dehydratase family protein [Dictyobacter kobayashii]|uniref:NAD-dependent epimerase/dehydratase domain-containing protein n=1 Tax=Dictyobacter kobayashii TaxID=2014872 RepID=A0A402ACA4_9CHLR|nr:NAD-dependent epimerase/dehydratase family protein [Dictyobacter kobayashii]GCE16719.1 hypothetical protein KDK_05190 [Dictyobacter kobayashii]